MQALALAVILGVGFGGGYASAMVSNLRMALTGYAIGAIGVTLLATVAASMSDSESMALAVGIIALVPLTFAFIVGAAIAALRGRERWPPGTP